MIYDKGEYIPSAQEVSNAVNRLPDPKTALVSAHAIRITPLFPVMVKSDQPQHGIRPLLHEPAVDVVATLETVQIEGQSSYRYWRIEGLTIHN